MSTKNAALPMPIICKSLDGFAVRTSNAAYGKVYVGIPTSRQVSRGCLRRKRKEKGSREESWSGRWTGSMHAYGMSCLSQRAQSVQGYCLNPSKSRLFVQTDKVPGIRSVGRVLKRLEHLGFIKRWKQYNQVINGVKVLVPRDIFISKNGYSGLQAKIADLLGRARRKKQLLTPPQRSWWTRLFKDKLAPNNRRPAIPDVDHGQLATGSFGITSKSQPR